jgi:hypothetical protein
MTLGAAVTVAAVLAVSSRDARVATVGLVGALALAPMVADPLPDPLAIGVRIVAAVLAVALLRVATRPSPLTTGSRIGWPATALAAAAAFVAGLVGHAAITGASGPGAAAATGAAVGIVALAPALDRRDVLRLTTGLLLLLASADLIRAATLGSPDGLAELSGSSALIAISAAGATLLAVGRPRPTALASTRTPLADIDTASADEVILGPSAT